MNGPGMPPMPMAPPVPPGTTAPATMPPQNKGIEGEGRIAMSAVVTALEHTAPLFSVGSPEKNAILKAAAELSRIFGKASQDLSQASIKQLSATAPAISPGPGLNAAITDRLGSLGISPSATGEPT